MTLWHEERLLIDGDLVAAEGGATFDTVNPSTGEVLGTAADASLADVERAIAAARRAFDTTTGRPTGPSAAASASSTRRWSTTATSCATCSWPRSGRRSHAHRGPAARHAGGDGRLVRRPAGEVRLPRGPRACPRVPRPDARPLGGEGGGRRRRRDRPYNCRCRSRWRSWCRPWPPAARSWSRARRRRRGSALSLGKLVAEDTDIPAGVVNVLNSAARVGEAGHRPRVDMVSFTGSTPPGAASCGPPATP